MLRLAMGRKLAIPVPFLFSFSGSLRFAAAGTLKVIEVGKNLDTLAIPGS
jgi:hypothetical protein